MAGLLKALPGIMEQSPRVLGWAGEGDAGQFVPMARRYAHDHGHGCGFALFCAGCFIR
jgi:hypothetical protein